MKNVDRFKSHDFYLCCIILASGYSLVNLKKNNSNFVTFIFDISKEKANQIIKAHWDRELKIPSRDLIEAINELKTRLRSGV